MSDDQIDRLIDKSHLQRDKNVVEYVQEHLAGASEEKILERNHLKQKKRGIRRPKKITAHYYYPVFSNHLYGYQVDLLQRSNEDGKKKVDKDDTATGAKKTRREYPPFFFIAINTNTKYVYAYALQAKTDVELLRVMKLWFHDTDKQINSIRCDEEAGLDSRAVNDWCEARKISIKSIRDQNHTSLSVVDRVIRTLRDMNVPTEKSKRTSMNRKYRDFTVKRMNKLVKIYNDTTHKATGHKPSKMQSDSEDGVKGAELERAYIIKKIYESERRHKLTDYNLKQDTYVKYIVPRKDMEKHRYKVSPECYKIKGKDGHAYIIMAKDGSTLTITRWRLIPIGKTIPKGMKMARSVNSAKHGVIVKIEAYKKGWRATKKARRKNVYVVLWKSPDGERIVTHEPIELFKRERRRRDVLTKDEKAFWEGKDIPPEIFA
jgi:hypothetical protein